MEQRRAPDCDHRAEPGLWEVIGEAPKASIRDLGPAIMAAKARFVEWRSLRRFRLTEWRKAGKADSHDPQDFTP